MSNKANTTTAPNANVEAAKQALLTSLTPQELAALAAVGQNQMTVTQALQQNPGLATKLCSNPDVINALAAEADDAAPAVAAAAPAAVATADPVQLAILKRLEKLEGKKKSKKSKSKKDEDDDDDDEDDEEEEADFLVEVKDEFSWTRTAETAIAVTVGVGLVALAIYGIAKIVGDN